MKTTLISTLILVATATAGPIKPSPDEGARTQGHILAHEKTVEVPLALNTKWASYGGFMIDVEVGTPAQSMKVLLDTGNSDFWIPSSATSNCQAGDCPGGSFDASKLSTYAVTNGTPPFKMGYADGQGITGDFVTDTVPIGGAVLRNQTFGLGHKIKGLVEHSMYLPDVPGAAYGVLGLGFWQSEFNPYEQEEALFTYATVPMALKEAGHTASQSYSLATDATAGGGSIIFGGVDTKKYDDELQTIKLDRTENDQYIDLGGFTLKYKGQTIWQTPKNYSGSSGLDCGYTAFNVPESAVDLIREIVPFVEHDWEVLTPCSNRDEDISITVHFKDPNGGIAAIDVPFANLLVPAHVFEDTRNYNDSASLITNGTEQCLLAARGDDDDFEEFNMGVPFFKSAYTLFNLDEHTISMAPIRHTRDSQVVGIGANRGVTKYPPGSGGKAD